MSIHQDQLNIARLKLAVMHITAGQERAPSRWRVEPTTFNLQDGHSMLTMASTCKTASWSTS